MRTVTFADGKVIEMVNDNFIPVWDNHSSEAPTHGEQAKFTESEVEAYPEGGGAGNLLTYVVAPDGRAIAELQGFWRPERYLEELNFARDLTADKAREKHTQRVKTLREEVQKLTSEYPEEMNKRIAESTVRKKIAATGILITWHEHSSTMAQEKIDVLLAGVRLKTIQRGAIV